MIKNQISNIKYQKGQVVLILVLITVVGLTVGLSLISRTVTDVRISSQIEQSGRAFSAAEAGIETALKTAIINGPTGTIELPGADASYNVTALGDSTNIYSFPLTPSGQSQTIWLVPHNDDGTLKETEPRPPVGKAYPPDASFDLCWGSDVLAQPAVVLSLYYKDGSDYKVAKLAYDSLGSRGNNFYLADTTGNYCNGIYRFKKTLQPNLVPENGFGVSGASITLLALRIHVLYDSTAFAIKPSTAALPLQGKLITSTGETNTGIVRRVQVNQGYPSLPGLLDFTLFREN